MAGRELGWGCNYISCQHTDWPPGEGTEENVSTIHSPRGKQTPVLICIFRPKGMAGIIPRRAKESIPLNHHLGHSL